MTLSFSKLNEIAHLYENAVHGEQEVLGEAPGMDIFSTPAAQKSGATAVRTFFTKNPGTGMNVLKGAPGKTIDQAQKNKAAETIFGLRSGSLSRPSTGKPPATPAGDRPTGNAPATAPGGAGARPPGGNSPKLLPAKPAAPAKPAIPTGTTAGGTTFQRRAATGDELRAAQDARAAAKAAGNTKGAEEAAVKAGVNASKPATPSLGQRAAAMPSSGSSQFKPATTSQATNAAGSNSAAASGSLVPASNKIASSLKSIDLKASYEYDVYDLVLEYLLDNGHVDTVEEANYVMMEMDAETIGNIVEARMDPRGRPASGPMNVYAKSKGKPDQAHSDAVKAYDAAQKKKTPEQRKKELDDYKERQMNR